MLAGCDGHEAAAAAAAAAATAAALCRLLSVFRAACTECGDVDSDSDDDDGDRLDMSLWLRLLGLVVGLRSVVVVVGAIVGMVGERCCWCVC